MYRILLVDDEILALKGLQSMVDWSRYQIEPPILATSMKQAIAAMEKQEIQILICDIQMPNGSGLELLAWMNEHFPDIVTVFLTFYEKFEYVRQALSLGAFDYLLKPASEEALEETLCHCIRKVEDIRKHRENEKKAELLSKMTGSTEEIPHTVVEKTIAYINQNLDKELTRKEICDQVYVHQDYLSKIFKKETGKTISEYIFDTRIALAKELLEKTDESIGVICERVGYSFNSHFSKMFRIKTGVSPQQYRSSVRKQDYRPEK